MYNVECFVIGFGIIGKNPTAFSFKLRLLHKELTALHDGTVCADGYGLLQWVASLLVNAHATSLPLIKSRSDFGNS